MGLPIVTTPVDGIPEQVEEGKNALFYASGDIAGLRSLLIDLLEDAGLRSRLAQGSRELRNSAGSFLEMSTEYLNVFEAVVVDRRNTV